jgi:hypothetical protein
MQPKPSVELTNFMEASKAKGISDEFLTALLIQHGWPKDAVFAALGAYWESVTGMPLPDRAGHGESSRDAFLYLLSFATLATWASALGSMLFRFIEYWFPDPVVALHADNLRNAVTWQMASTAVAFPIFLVVMRTILAEARKQPERLQSGVRRWLTYIALLLTAGGLICDLIWFLNYFLTGELTVRFLLKVFTVLAICGAIFFYYLHSLRWDKEDDLTPAWSQSGRFGAAAAAIVIASFCVGLGVAGSPSEQRHLEADRRRVEDLRQIANSLHARFVQAETTAAGKSVMLPSALSELVGHGINGSQIRDPESGKSYEYRTRAATTYELCATFSETTERDPVPVTQFWRHGKGQTCYTMDASVQPEW